LFKNKKKAIQEKKNLTYEIPIIYIMLNMKYKRTGAGFSLPLYLAP